MAMRGRTYLRMQLAQPDAASVAKALAVFEIAVARAVQATSRHSIGGASDWPTTAATAWQDIQPAGPPTRPRQ
jgi:hypothetical protein